MRAAVLEEFGMPLVIREFEHPRLEVGQMLVRMLAAGVCGSDIHMWHGQDPRTHLPTILGHEGVGEVVETGPGSQRPVSASGREVSPGDRVIWDRGVACGRCYFCAVKQEPNLCPNRWAYGINRSCEDPPHLVGCFADHIVLFPSTKILHVDEYAGASYQLLASTSCSGSTAAHAVELANIQPGDAVLIQGSGPLGLYLTAFARQAGASQVITVGGSLHSLNIAKKLGADLAVSYRITSPEERANLARERAPHGIDIILESTGDPESVNEGIALLRTGGTYISTGFAVPGTTITLDCYREIVRKHLRLQGIWVSHTRHLHQALSLVSRNPEPFEAVVTQGFPLEQATEALRALQDREAIKSAIVF